MAENINLSKIYSFSKLERFAKCPLGYYFYYLDPKWKGHKKPKDYNTKGQAVHGAITLFYHLPERERTFSNLKECLYQAWFSEQSPEMEPPLGEAGGFKDLEHERKTYKEALMALKNFYNLKEINPPLFYLPTKNIRYSFSDYGDLVQPVGDQFFISGKFDRIDRLEDESLKIIDYKTSKNNQNRFQLDFYRILAELNFQLPVNTVSYYYLDRGEVINFKTEDFSPQDIKNKILEKIAMIQGATEFPPKPSRLCGHCDFKEICPIFK